MLSPAPGSVATAYRRRLGSSERNPKRSASEPLRSYQIPYKKAVQTISYLPHFLSWVILGAIFTQLLSPSTGAVNILLTKLGFEPIRLGNR